MVEDWLANAYEGMSRRQFLAKAGATGVSLVGFAIAATPVAGEIINTPISGIDVKEGTIPSGTFPMPIYEAKPAAAGKYPVVFVIPEIFGMHEHIKDVARRFAKAGYIGITFRTLCPRRGCTEPSGHCRGEESGSSHTRRAGDG